MDTQYLTWQWHITVLTTETRICADGVIRLTRPLDEGVELGSEAVPPENEAVWDEVDRAVSMWGDLFGKGQHPVPHIHLRAANMNVSFIWWQLLYLAVL